MALIDAHPQAAAAWGEIQTEFGGDLLHLRHGTQGHVLMIAGGTDGPRYTAKVEIPDDKREHTVGLEGAVVSHITNTQPPPPVAIQRQLKVTQGYVVNEWLPGTVFSHTEAQAALSEEDREVLGYDIGSFVAWSAGIDITNIVSDISKVVGGHIAQRPLSLERTHHRWPRWWRDFVLDESGSDRLTDLKLPNLRLLSDYVACFTAPLTPTRRLFRPQFWGHNDLHNGNLVFNKDNYGDWRLSGVLDWGVSGPSTIHREARHLASLGQGALEGALVAFQDAGLAKREETMVDIELMRVWAIIQVATAAITLSEERDVHEAYPEMKDMMETVSPRRDWSELDRFLA